MQEAFHSTDLFSASLSLDSSLFLCLPSLPAETEFSWKTWLNFPTMFNGCQPRLPHLYISPPPHSDWASGSQINPLLLQSPFVKPMVWDRKSVSELTSFLNKTLSPEVTTYFLQSTWNCVFRRSVTASKPSCGTYIGKDWLLEWHEYQR